MTLCALTAAAPCVLLPLASSSLSRTPPYNPDLLPELAPLLTCPFQSTLHVVAAPCMHLLWLLLACTLLRPLHAAVLLSTCMAFGILETAAAPLAACMLLDPQTLNLNPKPKYLQSQGPRSLQPIPLRYCNVMNEVNEVKVSKGFRPRVRACVRACVIYSSYTTHARTDLNIY